MSCDHYRDGIVDLAREAIEDERTARQIAEHLAVCPSCRQRHRDQLALSAGLRALAAAARDSAPTAPLEARLVDEFNAQAAHRRRRRRRYEPAWAKAAAAVVLAVGAVAAWKVAYSPPAPDLVRLEGFDPLPAAATLPGFERGEIVRIDVPVPSLPAYGIAIPPDAAERSIAADLLIGQDGLPRAIRLVRRLPDSRSRP
jgi:hypothetical protein